MATWEADEIRSAISSFSKRRPIPSFNTYELDSPTDINPLLVSKIFRDESMVFWTEIRAPSRIVLQLPMINPGCTGVPRPSRSNDNTNIVSDGILCWPMSPPPQQMDAGPPWG